MPSSPSAGRLSRGGRPRTAAALVALTLAVGLWNVKLVAEKSLSAVAAAGHLARDEGVRTVVLSQAWAFGDHIVLGNGVAVRDVATPPRPAELRAALAGADAACLYAGDLARDPRLRAELAGAGLVEADTFHRWRARDVVVFAAPRRRPEPKRGRS